MATNPMQRKARNSFLFGVLIAVVIMGAIAAILLWQLRTLKEEQAEREAAQVSVYVLTCDVKSGESVYPSMFKRVAVDKSAAPTNKYTTMIRTEDEEGNELPIGLAKIELAQGTVVTPEMIVTSEESQSSSIRKQEYNMIKLTTQLETDDYVDIRLRMPSGLDYIVVSKKRVEIPEIEGIPSLNTIWLELSEEETLTMSNAIVEAYKMEGAILYTAQYVEAGIQEAAIPTYTPSTEVINLTTQNPNIVNEAKQALYNRYTSAQYTANRNNINGELSQYSDTALDGVNSGVSSEVTSAQEERQSYLDSL